MKKVLLSFVCCLLPAVCSADYEYTSDSGLKYKVTDAVKSAWGNPKLSDTYIQDASINPGAFRIKNGWACCSDSKADVATRIKQAQQPYNDQTKIGQDDQAVMAFVANNITEHGAQFCLTQFHAYSSTGKFSLIHQQPYRPELQCAWFCEPGYDGEGCKEKTNSDMACNMTNYAQEIARVKTSQYPSTDSITLHGMRMGVAEYTAVLDNKLVNGRYPHEIVVGAFEFLDHGIKAKPITVAVVGNHPVTTSVTTSETTSGKQKVLCAQGFTADENCNVSSKNCGKTMWCDQSFEGRFDAKIHVRQINDFCETFVCKEATDALDDDFKCKPCQDSSETGRKGRCNVLGQTAFGKCVECNVGQYFDVTTCSCEKARQLTKDIMQYGRNRSDVVTNQCWSKEDAASYKACVTAAIE